MLEERKESRSIMYRTVKLSGNFVYVFASLLGTSTSWKDTFNFSAVCYLYFLFMYLRNSKEKLINKGKANIILVYFYLTCIDQLRNKNNIFTEKRSILVFKKNNIGAQNTTFFWSIWHRSMIASVLSYMKK